MMDADEAREAQFWRRTAYQVGTGVLLLIAGSMYGCPQYSVWTQGLTGEGELRRAEQNRRIKIQEAQAAYESSKFLANAEVERAKGVAQANEIVSSSLGGPEGYLRYLYINNIREVAHKGDQIIYIPTEAALPILEANRLKKAEKHD